MRIISILCFFLFCWSLTSCGVNTKENASANQVDFDSTVSVQNKMTGVSLEMPSVKIDGSGFKDIAEINAEWVAHIPFGITRQGSSSVEFSYSGRWWGETVEGTKKCVEMAREAGLKSMLKPHVWVIGQGWPGHFTLSTEKEWLNWESTYRDYILAYAHLADTMDVEMFCIGTEFRIAVVERAPFWRSLIKEIRSFYDGELTYASNWDNYEKVTFWDDLDVIGIDAYFPLSKSKNPTLSELTKKWKPVVKKLGAFSKKKKRSILFTEYGFKSSDYVSSGLGDADQDSLKANMENQSTAYTAFFKTIWQEDWMAGGFFWKWHLVGDHIGGPTNKRYTPQGKTALEVIRSWYGAVEE